MQVGFIGAGNMARAIARGWAEPVHVTSPSGARAQALVDELGGTAYATNVELAAAVDVVLLCHKPKQLSEVAAEISEQAGTIVSVLGGVGLEQLKAAYPRSAVISVLPNTPVEIRAGVICHARDAAPPPVTEDVLARFSRLGRVVTLPEPLGAATALMGNAPAYMALVAEAQVDAGVRRGVPADVAIELVLGTMVGTAELIRARAGDTLAVRREVTSPGGSTAKGLAALEAAGLRDAFSSAMDAVTA